MRNAQRENKLQTEKQNSKTVSAVQNPTTPLVAVPSATPAPTSASASADQSQVQGISKKGHKSSGTQIEGKPENKNSPIKQKERNKNNKQQQKATEIPAAGDLEEVLVVKQQEPNLPPAGDINFESDDMI